MHHLERPMHFRPIGLCNISYKIITNAMTNRLKEVMKEAIGPHQSSFVLNRQIMDNPHKKKKKKQIMDNILIYQEVLNTI